MSIFFAEVIGTFILIYLGCGVVAGDLLSFLRQKVQVGSSLHWLGV